MRLSRAALCAALLAATAAGPATAARSLLAADPTAAATATPDGFNDPTAALARLDPDVLATITGTGTPRDPEASVKGTGPASKSAGDYQAPVEMALGARAPSDRQSVAQVNEAAPVFQIPTKDGLVEARPALSVQGAGSGPASAAVGAPSADPAALAASAAVASPGYGTAGYIPPNNPAFAAGAPAPALAALLADATAAAAPAAAAMAARQAAMDASVPVFANDAAQPPEATGVKPSAAAVALAAGGALPASAAAVVPAAQAQPAAPAAAATQPAPAAATAAGATAAPAGVLAVPPPAGGGGSSAAAASDNGGRPATLNTAPNAPDGGGKAAAGGGGPPDASAGNNGAGAVAAKGIDNTSGQVLGTVGGTTLNLLLGGRVATPFFGTGFNLCVDRYFGSFPKVGVVIPNPVAWLLPEILDVAGTLKATVDLPLGGKTAPEGARVTPTSDGFVIWLPSSAFPLLKGGGGQSVWVGPHASMHAPCSHKRPLLLTPPSPPFSPPLPPSPSLSCLAHSPTHPAGRVWVPLRSAAGPAVRRRLWVRPAQVDVHDRLCAGVRGGGARAERGRANGQRRGACVGGWFGGRRGVFVIFHEKGRERGLLFNWSVWGWLFLRCSCGAGRERERESGESRAGRHEDEFCFCLFEAEVEEKHETCICHQKNSLKNARRRRDPAAPCPARRLAQQLGRYCPAPGQRRRGEQCFWAGAFEQQHRGVLLSDLDHLSTPTPRPPARPARTPGRRP